MDKIIYLVRHGKTDKSKLKKQDNEMMGNNELDLDESFIPVIETAGNKLGFDKFEKVYASNFLRAKRTAKLLCKNAVIEIDSRLGERVGGTPNLDITPQQYYKMQLEDENYKFPDGESVLEIRNRMTAAINDILNNSDYPSNVVVSHGAAITFYLTKWCKVTVVDTEKKIRRFEFNGKIIHEGIVNFVQCFKLTFDENNNLKDIQIVN